MSSEKASVLADLKARQAMITENPNVVPVARLDFLDLGGKVMASEEYHSENDLVKALQEELYYGVPLVVVLYRNEKGNTISKNFLEGLDTMPKGIREEDAPKVQLHKNTCKKGEER